MANKFPILAGSAIGLASKTPSSQQQKVLLEQTKTLAEAAVQLLYAVQESGGNPKVWLHWGDWKIYTFVCARLQKHTQRQKKQQSWHRKQLEI